MNTASTESSGDRRDPFELSRFVLAQQGIYERALAEVKNGQKRSHWMWFIFPQLRGLGHSSTAKLYGITGAEEARAYLAHEVLGPRLTAICEAALAVEGRSATAVFGTPDDMKLRSCATLFAQVSNGDSESVFQQIIEKYFGGTSDFRTLQLLKHG